MKRKTIVLTILLVLALLSVNIIPVFAESVTALDDATWESKIDKGLRERMDKSVDDEKIPVSIWVKDINHREIKEEVKQRLAFEIENNTISEDAIDVVFYDDLLVDSNEKYAVDKGFASIESKAQRVDVSEAQLIINTERIVASQKYQEYNTSIVDSLFGNNDYCLIYSSRYTPNIEVYLSKNEILQCVKNSIVEYIYYSDPTIEIIEEEQSDITTQIRENYDTTFYTVTGLNTTRDAFHLNGNGMKVGMLEALYYPDESEVTSNNNHIHYGGTGTHSPTVSNHATTVAKLMIGDKDGYIGAIPNATLYYNGLFNSLSSLKPKFEQLLDCDVSAVNLSFGIGDTYNTYSDIAKWYDHVAIQHNVHVIISAGNDGSTGVISSNMSYNSIVVGNCNNYGTIHTDNEGRITSSYCNDTPLPYKPDLVAPGTEIEIIPNYYHPGTPQAQAGLKPSGTSFSAPLVTSAVIQLAQSSSLLLSNPVLMKSLIISSSIITNGMSGEPIYSIVNGNNIALSRIYGGGMLYVPNAYIAFHSKSYYYNGTLNENVSSIDFNCYLTKVTNKKMRVCLTWNKICSITGTHATGTINESNLDKIELIITDPLGNTYTSAYEYDNKQMITFNPSMNGNYSFEINRIGNSSLNNNINYSITWSLQ